MGADDPNLAQRIAHDQEENVRHDAVDPPAKASPFSTSRAEQIFWKALRDLDIADDNIPKGFGVAEEDWDGGIYPEFEAIKVARKDIYIKLPFSMWWPRAVRWSRSLELVIYLRILEEQGNLV